MSSIRWALVGTSDFALEWIAPALARAKGSSLAAVVSRDRSRAAAAAAQVGAAEAYASIEAIDRDLVDGVVLVTPNSAHAAGAIAALRRGLHVIVEKPMSHSVAECEKMIAAAERSGTMLAVAHCMEWAPPIVAAIVPTRVSRFLTCASSCARTPSSSVSSSSCRMPSVAATAACSGLRPVANALGDCSGMT